MILFNEGLPRSGKSYEAMAHHIIPAIRNGRQVFAHMDGLNWDKIAEVCEITPERCRELLHHIDDDQITEIYKHVADNALIVIDEVQDYWPNGRKALPQPMSEFITRHGHRGLDILLMGQDMRDVHAIWRRRVAQKSVYTKLDGVGMENHYNVTTWKASRAEKFEKVANERSRYDPKYFGTYKSHDSDTVQTGNYKDRRANIWNSPGFRLGLPAAAVAAVVAVWYLVAFFRGDVEFVKTPEAKEAPQSGFRPPPQSLASSAPSESHAAPAEPVSAPKDYVQKLTAESRIRLSHWIRIGDREIGAVEWYNNTHRVESLTFDQLQYFGYQVRYVSDLVELTKGDTVITATSWPMDPVYRASERQLDQSGRTDG